MTLARASPTNLACFCFSFGSLPESMEIKIMLSIPSTISRIVIVSSAIKACGSVIHSIWGYSNCKIIAEKLDSA